MEIYRETLSTIKVDVPVGFASISVRGYVDDEEISGFVVQPAAVGDSTATISVPYAATLYDQQIKVILSFNIQNSVVSKTVYVDVVTPILPLSKVKSIATFLDDSQIADLEKSVRTMVRAYTGQFFGLYKATQDVVVRNGHITLPSPIVKLNEVNGSTDLSGYVITNNSFRTTGAGGEYLTIKMAPPEDGIWVSSGVIYAPRRRDSCKDDYRVFTINGDWGYNSVPGDVEEAAALLVAEYACDETTYRDKYIEVMKAQDWTIQFSRRDAYAGTGNARADLILYDYRQQRFAVI